MPLKSSPNAASAGRLPVGQSVTSKGARLVRKVLEHNAIACGLIADGTAIVAGIFIAYLFFH